MWPSLQSGHTARLFFFPVAQCCRGMTMNAHFQTYLKEGKQYNIQEDKHLSSRKV